MRSARLLFFGAMLFPIVLRAAPPDAAKTAIAEAITVLQIDSAVMSQAYRDGGNKFPPTANPPFAIDKPDNTTYISKIEYQSGRPDGAVIVVTLGDTGITDLDGHILVLHASGQPNGSVLWWCGAAFAGDSEGGKVMLHRLMDACQGTWRDRPA